MTTTATKKATHPSISTVITALRSAVKGTEFELETTEGFHRNNVVAKVTLNGATAFTFDMVAYETGHRMACDLEWSGSKRESNEWNEPQDMAKKVVAYFRRYRGKVAADLAEKKARRESRDAERQAVIDAIHAAGMTSASSRFGTSIYAIYAGHKFLVVRGDKPFVKVGHLMVPVAAMPAFFDMVTANGIQHDWKKTS